MHRRSQRYFLWKGEIARRKKEPRMTVSGVCCLYYTGKVVHTSVKRLVSTLRALVAVSFADATQNVGAEDLVGWCRSEDRRTVAAAMQGWPRLSGAPVQDCGVITWRFRSPVPRLRFWAGRLSDKGWWLACRLVIMDRECVYSRWTDGWLLDCAQGDKSPRIRWRYRSVPHLLNLDRGGSGARIARVAWHEKHAHEAKAAKVSSINKKRNVSSSHKVCVQISSNILQTGAGEKVRAKFPKSAFRHFPGARLRNP